MGGRETDLGFTYAFQEIFGANARSLVQLKEGYLDEDIPKVNICYLPEEIRARYPGGNFITPVTSAVHKRLDLLRAMGEIGLMNTGLLLLDRRTKLRKAAKVVSRNEPPPGDAFGAVDFKLSEAIGEIEEDGEFGIITVGDLAMQMTDLGGHPLSDLNKPGQHVPLDKYVSHLFELGRNEILQIDYGAATGWARRVVDKPGKRSDEMRRLLLNQKLFMDFDVSTVKYFADTGNVGEFVNFVTAKRIALVRYLAEQTAVGDGEAMGAVIGPSLHNCAGAIPIEYMIWYIAEAAPESAKLSVILKLPREAEIAGVAESSNIVINRQTVAAGLPIIPIIRYAMAHVHNYPNLSVRKAIDFFWNSGDSNNGSGYWHPVRIKVS